MQRHPVLALATLAVLATAATVPAAPEHVPGGAERSECKETAPDRTACTTGPHVLLAGSASHGFFPLVQPTYTGTLASSLVHATSSFILRCDVQAGVIERCTTTGYMPPERSVVLHVCSSYEKGTFSLGGAGEWGCFIHHS